MVIEAEPLDISGQVQGLFFIDPNGTINVRNNTKSNIYTMSIDFLKFVSIFDFSSYIKIQMKKISFIFSFFVDYYLTLKNVIIENFIIYDNI